METTRSREQLKRRLDILYERYNRRDFVAPDPLLFLYAFSRAEDREIAGFIAASLAYGRVEMIMKAVAGVLEKMGPSPQAFVLSAREHELTGLFKGFCYRFARGEHLTALILGLQQVLLKFGSLESCLLGENDVPANQAGSWDIDQGLGRLYAEISSGRDLGHLMADPGKNSACKRSHLFLRWMVRRDRVDPGGWDRVSPADLRVPVDTHMLKIGKVLGFTRRSAGDRVCALEITSGFRRLVPGDPVRYDFALTRFGIRRQMDLDTLAVFLRTEDDE